MKVKFLQDFQGRETKEIFYKFGDIVDLPDHMAQQLVADRRVELVDFPKPTTAVEFAEPVVFENVTAVEPHPVDEPAEDEAPKPKGKRGKK